MKTRRSLIVVALALAFCVITSEASAAGPPSKHQGVININTASADQLTFLPRIGQAKAERILEYRAARPFKKVVELARVKGIGLKTIRNLKPWLRVDGETTVTGPIKVERRVPPSATPAG